jgi:uncharacterized protein YbjQ (UPF0145 family)
MWRQAQTKGRDAEMATTALDSPGWRIVRNVGVARSVVVRWRSPVGNFVAGLQTLFGGAISAYANLCEQTRAETYRMMCDHAALNGANAIVAMRYGAAVVAEPNR